MAFHIIYFFIILIYGLWIVGIKTNNDILALISSLLMFPLAIYVFVNGMDIFTNSELLCMMFAGVTFILAVYTSFQATYNMYKGM